MSYLTQTRRQTAELIKLIPGLLAEATTVEQKLDILKQQTRMVASMRTRRKKRKKAKPKSDGWFAR